MVIVMASKVSIWNLSLARIKSSALIQSDTEESTERRAFDNVWANSLKATLELFDWNFARARQTLAELAEAAPTEWTYRYAYPTDCLAARYIATASGVEDAIPFEVVLSTDRASKNILTNITPVCLVFTANISDPNLFSGSFTEALSWKLGAEVGPSLGASAKNIKAANDGFTTAVQQASVHSVKEGENRAERESGYVEARA